MEHKLFLAKYRVARAGRLEAEAFLGVQFEQFYYKDKQRVSNHIEADLGPMLVAGLAIGF